MLPVCAAAALERPEGVAQQDYVAMEEFQQRTNAVSLERVKAYYRKLRYAEPANSSRRPHPGRPGNISPSLKVEVHSPRCVSPHRAEEPASTALSLLPSERRSQGPGVFQR